MYIYVYMYVGVTYIYIYICTYIYTKQYNELTILSHNMTITYNISGSREDGLCFVLRHQLLLIERSNTYYSSNSRLGHIWSVSLLRACMLGPSPWPNYNFQVMKGPQIRGCPQKLSPWICSGGDTFRKGG